MCKRLHFPVFGVFLLTLTLSPAIAQFNQGGYIAPGDSLMKFITDNHRIFLPEDGFNLFDVPNGNFKGKILPGPPLYFDGPYLEIDTMLTSTFVGITNEPKLLSTDYYFNTISEQYYLAFDQLQDNYLRVFSDNYRGWISLDEIKAKGYEIISWMKFYGATKGMLIHPREKLAPILVGPTQNAAIIETADELYSEITLLGKCQGIFCMVNVVQYRNPYDPTKTKEQNILKKYRGWIQIIDAEGKPLVAHIAQEG